MKKRDRIIYWISTVWLSLGMVSTGIVQLLKVEKDVELIVRLGYPTYFLNIIGIWKLLGVVALLIPRSPLLKEWAYAGFFIAMSGAIFSHMASGSPVNEIFPALLLLILTVVSWYFRPSDKKVQLANMNR